MADGQQNQAAEGASPAKLEARAARLHEKWQQKAAEIKEIRLARKADVSVTHLGLAWAPFRMRPAGAEGGAELVRAYASREIPAESWRSAESQQEVEAS